MLNKDELQLLVVWTGEIGRFLSLILACLVVVGAVFNFNTIAFWAAMAIVAMNTIIANVLNLMLASKLKNFKEPAPEFEPLWDLGLPSIRPQPSEPTKKKQYLDPATGEFYDP